MCTLKYCTQLTKRQKTWRKAVLNGNSIHCCGRRDISAVLPDFTSTNRKIRSIYIAFIIFSEQNKDPPCNLLENTRGVP
jgi:hypothetical protein